MNVPRRVKLDSLLDSLVKEQDSPAAPGERVFDQVSRDPNPLASTVQEVFTLRCQGDVTPGCDADVVSAGLELLSASHVVSQSFQAVSRIVNPSA